MGTNFWGIDHIPSDKTEVYKRQIGFNVSIVVTTCDPRDNFDVPAPYLYVIDTLAG